MADDQNFRGIILVRKDSEIKNFSDLKNKVVSYPAPTALAATMMPQMLLYKNGIDINKDIKNIYVGSQESSIMSVFLKKSDAAPAGPPPWKAFIKKRPEIKKQVMIKWQTTALPNNGLVVRKDSRISGVLSNVIINPFVNVNDLKNVFVLKVVESHQIDQLELNLLKR